MVRIVKVGINLDSTKGNIKDWEIKENKRNRPGKAQAFHFQLEMNAQPFQGD